MMERLKCTVAEFRKSNVFNESLNISLKTIDLQHPAAAHFHRSRGNLCAAAHSLESTAVQNTHIVTMQISLSKMLVFPRGPKATHKHYSKSGLVKT